MYPSEEESYKSDAADGEEGVIPQWWKERDLQNKEEKRNSADWVFNKTFTLTDALHGNLYIPSVCRGLLTSSKPR